ncbi:hypothetical protein QUB19_26975 [Microcoleus sp. B4-C5]|uniref:hypothetical protein n=1 Tax=unclassified Microcoleus TaxID=2642155 RepID=UPI002FD448FA
MTDKAMVDVGFAGINPTYEQKRSALMASSVQARCSLSDERSSNSEHQHLYWLRD